MEIILKKEGGGFQIGKVRIIFIVVQTTNGFCNPTK